MKRIADSEGRAFRETLKRGVGRCVLKLRMKARRAKRGTGNGIARRRLSLFWRAVQCGFALDWGRFSGLAARALKFCADGTYEKALLGGLVPLVRNNRGDLRRATGIFERLQGSFEKHELKEARRSACEKGYVFRLYVLTLYARASCYYYGELAWTVGSAYHDGCFEMTGKRGVSKWIRVRRNARLAEFWLRRAGS